MRKEVENKIAELLKDTDLNIIWEEKNIISPIREGELLMALYFSRSDIAIDNDGEFLIDERSDLNYTNTFTFWKLGYTLHDQSDEVIEFLHKILVG